MSEAPVTEPTLDSAEDSATTAIQQAIRKRALDTIAEQQSRPPTPLSRRLLIIGLTLGAVLVFLLLVNFVVTGMRKIMETWYPGSISGSVTQPVPARPITLGPDQPFYISVDPPLEATPSGETAATSNAGAVKNPHH